MSRYRNIGIAGIAALALAGCHAHTVEQVAIRDTASTLAETHAHAEAQAHAEEHAQAQATIEDHSQAREAEHVTTTRERGPVDMTVTKPDGTRIEYHRGADRTRTRKATAKVAQAAVVARASESRAATLDTAQTAQADGKTASNTTHREDSKLDTTHDVGCHAGGWLIAAALLFVAGRIGWAAAEPYGGPLKAIVHLARRLLGN